MDLTREPVNTNVAFIYRKNTLDKAYKMQVVWNISTFHGDHEAESQPLSDQKAIRKDPIALSVGFHKLRS
jgi:hypothetical protein